MELSAVFPCFNEEQNVAQVVQQAHRVLSELRDSGALSLFEIVVVDDGSADKTVRVLRELAQEIPAVRWVRHATNRGYGSALITGFANARLPWVFYSDGDGQYELSELKNALAALGEADLVIGYRARRGDESAVRDVNGRAWTALTNRLLGLGVRDVDCAFKLMPRNLLRPALRSGGAMIDAELLARARSRGLQIAEIPVSHLPRTAGTSTGADPRVVARAFLELGVFLARRAR